MERTSQMAGVGLVMEASQGPYQLVREMQDELRKRGCFLFRLGQYGGGECTAVLPTADPIEAVEMVGTEGANWKITNSQIVGWLRSLQQTHPFRLIVIGADRIEGKFLK